MGLTTEITSLNSDINKLSKQISKLENQIDTKTKTRESEHAIYAAKAKDLSEAIEACGSAIDALKDSKGDMSGAKVDLLQKAVTKVKGTAAPKFEYQMTSLLLSKTCWPNSRRTRRTSMRMSSRRIL